jgi:hypothetical protein
MPHDTDAKPSPGSENPIAVGVAYFLALLVVLLVGGFVARFALWLLDLSWGWLF